MLKTQSKSIPIEPFVKTAISVIHDVRSALKEDSKCLSHARVLLPLVMDFKHRGLILLKNQDITFDKKVSIWEHKLIEILENLDTLESILRSLPKPGCPEDVLLDGHLI